MALPFPPPYLCLVTDRSLRQERSLDEAVAQAVEGGVNMVQLREKDLPGGPLLELAARLRQRTRGRALLFVNERVDVALACGADGVQLGEQALPVMAARRLVPTGSGLLIGRSVHGAEGAAEAERQGADLLVAGSLFHTRSHPGVEPLGLTLLARIAAQAGVPVLGIGGVTAANAAQAIEAGAQGVAVISAILAAPDPREAAKELWDVLREAWNARGVRRD
ncbi:MAG: thiamine phosphate synthase [Chloroflexota bacterium]|nr:thiamine phosphate synthase [Chloroflexota bacterium]